MPDRPDRDDNWALISPIVFEITMIIWYSIHTKILLRISYYKVFEGLWPFSSQVYSTETLFWIGPDNNSKTKLGNQKNYKSFFSKSHRKWEKNFYSEFSTKRGFSSFFNSRFQFVYIKDHEILPKIHTACLYLLNFPRFFK